MNNNLSKLPWSEEIQNRIHQAVQDEANRIRVAAKVFPVLPYPGAANVPADVVNLVELTAEEGENKVFIEISRRFSLTGTQVMQEAELGTAAMLARFAAAQVVLTEDRVFFSGTNAPAPPTGVMVHREGSAEQGLLGVAEEVNTAIEVKGTEDEIGEKTFGAVNEGIAALEAQGQPGPYALFLHTEQFANTHQPAPGTLIHAADRIEPLVPAGFYSTGTLPDNTGLLVSRGGEPTNIAVSLDPTTEYKHPDEDLYLFRVVERVQFIARDPRALLRLDFVITPPAPH